MLLTGGDPLVMKTAVLRRYVEPLLDPALSHVETIRLGTPSLAYWPYRLTHGEDAEDLLRLFDQVRAAGRPLALMAHSSHPREREPPVAREALRRAQDAGAVVRCRAPSIRGVNDRAETWSELWSTQVRLGAVPYYLFVERDTGPRDYFAAPLADALELFNAAWRRLCGLGRTVRGPPMSATPDKVLVDGVAEVLGREVFVLKLLQARRREWAGRIFFAKYDPPRCGSTSSGPRSAARRSSSRRSSSPSAPTVIGQGVIGQRAARAVERRGGRTRRRGADRPPPGGFPRGSRQLCYSEGIP